MPCNDVADSALEPGVSTNLGQKCQLRKEGLLCPSAGRTVCRAARATLRAAFRFYLADPSISSQAELDSNLDIVPVRVLTRSRAGV